MTGVACVVESGDLLGEGPAWDAAGRALWWVDIEGRRLHRYRPDTGRADGWDLPAEAGCVVARERGGLLLALTSGLAFFDPGTGRLDPWFHPEPERAGNRFNEGKCDPQGRFWVSSMDARMEAWTGALYCCDPDGTWRRVLDGLGIPNTLVWAPGGRTLYFAESNRREIYAYDFDPASGALGRPRLFASTRGEAAVPDGSALDADGCLWNAQWDGWRVVRYAPDGTIDRLLPVPVQQPTSCAFGGPDLATLYITSARRGLDSQSLAGQPQAGGLFAADVGVQGFPEACFAG